VTVSRYRWSDTRTTVMSMIHHYDMMNCKRALDRTHTSGKPWHRWKANSLYFELCLSCLFRYCTVVWVSNFRTAPKWLSQLCFCCSHQSTNGQSTNPNPNLPKFNHVFSDSRISYSACHENQPITFWVIMLKMA